MPGMGLGPGNIVMNKITKWPTQLKQINLSPNNEDHCIEKILGAIKIGWPGKASLGGSICQRH